MGAVPEEFFFYPYAVSILKSRYVLRTCVLPRLAAVASFSVLSSLRCIWQLLHLAKCNYSGFGLTAAVPRESLQKFVLLNLFLQLFSAINLY